MSKVNFLTDMVPQDYPEAAYLLMQYLMGQADSLE